MNFYSILNVIQNLLTNNKYKQYHICIFYYEINLLTIE